MIETKLQWHAPQQKMPKNFSKIWWLSKGNKFYEMDYNEHMGNYLKEYCSYWCYNTIVEQLTGDNNDKNRTNLVHPGGKDSGGRGQFIAICKE